MYKSKTVRAVIPAHNEGSQIGLVIETMPEYVDEIVIIDDCSTDDTVEVVKKYQEQYSGITLFQHD